MPMNLRFAVFGAAVAAFYAFGSAGAAEMQSLKLVEHAENDTVTQTGEDEDNAGDLLTFANAVFDEANENQVGTDNGWCIRTQVGVAWECFWTISLEGGQITVEGPFLDDGDSVLAVTGGTGNYMGAKGEMALHSRNDEGTEYDFVYSLMMP